MSWINLLTVLLIMGVLIAIAYFGAFANYRECRSAGFSIRYCYTTHFVK